MRLAVGLIVCGLMVGGAAAQDTAKKDADRQVAAGAAQAAADKVSKPEFDVASVRPSETLDPGKMMAMVQAGKMPRFGAHVEGLRAEYMRMSLKQLIANAFEVKEYQVTGPDTIKSEPYDIVATMPEGSSKDDAPKMLRTLLEERFKLEAKKSTEDHPVYVLVAGKSGPKMKESATKPVPLDPKAELKPGEMKMDGPFGPMIIKRNPDGTSTANMGEKGSYLQKVDMQSRNLRFDATAVNMDGLAEMLTLMSTSIPGSTGRPVINKTDLKGYYDFSFDLSIAEMMRAQGAGAPGGGTEASDPGGGMSMEDSIQRLGLKLDPQKAPIEQVVVAHVEKTPTEN
jgi:uncharacterized protein (TIGR03435 family)